MFNHRQNYLDNQEQAQKKLNALLLATPRAVEFTARKPRSKITAQEVLSHTSYEIANIAAECGVDWHATSSFYNLYSGVEIRKPIPISKEYTGKIWCKYYENTNSYGDSYPVIIFKTFKHGENQKVFNGAEYLAQLIQETKDNQRYLFTSKPVTATVPVQSPITQPSQPELSKESEAAKLAKKKTRFNNLSRQFASLPHLNADSFKDSYLEQKGFAFDQIVGLNLQYQIKKASDTYGDFLLYPLQNEIGEVVGYQKIYNQQVDWLEGNKQYVFDAILKNGQVQSRKTGAYFIIGDSAIVIDNDKDNNLDRDIDSEQELMRIMSGERNKDKDIYLTEGFATGLSVALATGQKAVVCLDASGLDFVANILRHEHTVIVCADNDDKGNGNGNAGVYYGLKAARNAKGYIAIPKSLDNSKCDFNDIHKQQGLDAVKQQIDDSIQIQLKGSCSNAINSSNTPKLNLSETPIGVFYVELIKHIPIGMLRNELTKNISETIKQAKSKKDCLLHAKKLIKSAAKERGISGKEFNSIFKSVLHKYINGIKLSDTLPDYIAKKFNAKIYNVDGKSNKEIANLVKSLDGVIIDTRPMGAGKTELMGLVINSDNDNWSSECENAHNLVKAYHFQNGGTVDEWNTINNNPMLFNKLQNESQGFKPVALKPIHISPRVSLTRDASNRLNIGNYQDIKPWFYESLAVCINSIQKYNTASQNCIVLVDEARQVLNTILLGDTIKDRSGTYDHFVDTLNNAHKVIMADADFNADTLEWVASNVTKQLHIIQTTRASNGKSIKYFAHINSTIAKAVSSLISGNNIWCTTDSADQAEKLYTHFKGYDVLNEHDIICITSENKLDNKQAAFLANPNEESKKYRVVIHSPVISSGVSITNNHFNEVYAFFHNVLPPNEMMQSIGRVRTAKVIYVGFAKQDFERLRPTDKLAILEGEKEKLLDFYEETNKAELTQLGIDRVNFRAAQNKRLNGYKNHFLVLAEIKGYKVIALKEKLAAKGYRESCDITKVERITSILNANDISELEANRLRNADATTQAQTYSLDKYKTKKMARGKQYIDASDIEFYLEGGESIVNNHLLLDTDIENLKGKDKRDNDTENLNGSRVSKKKIITKVLDLLPNSDSILAGDTLKAIKYLNKNHGYIAANHIVGNYKKTSKHYIKQLNQFLKQFGFELIENGYKKRQRVYKLTVHYKVTEYKANQIALAA